MTKKIVNMALIFIVGLTWLTTVEALPNFAAKHEKNCSYCHSPWPQLNKKGRHYKENGYRKPEEVGKDIPFDTYSELGTFPISSRIISRPYDEKKRGERKIRALHEVEVYVAGAFGKDWSGFAELEAEDENDFNLEVPSAVLNWNIDPMFNVQAGWTDIFWDATSGLLSDNQRLTRGHAAVIDSRFGGADAKVGATTGGRLRDSRQMIGVNGRLFDRVNYSASVAGAAKDAEGVHGSTFFGRVSAEVMDDILLGVFGMAGANSDDDRDFDRLGADFQATIDSALGSTVVQGAFIHGRDDRDPAVATGSDKNAAWSVQTFHTFKDQSGKPTVTPLIRYDHREAGDGQLQTEEITYNLSYYIKQNIRAYFEFFHQLKRDTGDEDRRFTVQLEIGV